MKKHTIYTFLVLLLLAVQFAQAQDKGIVKIDALVSSDLADNVTKEDTTRPLAIYLPPSYSNSTKRYPVLYLLHGIGDDHLNFVDDTEKYQNIQDLMDSGIASHRFGEMIIVTPNEKTNWFGSFYVNSLATGNWEDFTAKELVTYIDTNYRTIAKAESRAIAGHSMGGYGAISLAMKHPDIFSVAYAMNGGFVCFAGEITANNPDVRKFVLAKNYDELLATKSNKAMGMLTVAQAFSPNPQNPTFFADKPFKLQGKKVVPNPSAYNKWLENDVVKMAEKYQENLLKLRGIKFDSGFDDEYQFIPINSRLFSKKLTALNIPHQFEEYNGDHRNRLWGLKGRIYNEVLPFVFDNLLK
jgi:S-formylglutathione hydrolase FrmB